MSEDTSKVENVMIAFLTGSVFGGLLTLLVTGRNIMVEEATPATMTPFDPTLLLVGAAVVGVVVVVAGYFLLKQKPGNYTHEEH